MCSLLHLPKLLLTMCIKALISSDTSTRRSKVFTDLSLCVRVDTEVHKQKTMRACRQKEREGGVHENF